MSLPKLPVRPSLESLRKQAKQLAHGVAAGDANATARVQAHLPRAKPPLSLRDAQLVVAREYGFSGWPDLLKEVKMRLGEGFEWAVPEARRRIHDNNLEGLRQLLTEYPALLSWQDAENDGGLLGMATGSFSDSGNPVSEEHFTRGACAELLLDAGAVVAPIVCDRVIDSRARGLIDLFRRRGLLPRTLKFFAALGDMDALRASLDANDHALAAVNEAFLHACRLQQPAAAALLLDRSIALDAELGRRVDDGPGREALIQYFLANTPDVPYREPFKPWEAFVQQEVMRLLHEGDLADFVDRLRRDRWLLSEASLKFQVVLIEATAVGFHDRTPFLQALFDLDPAILHCAAPPKSMAFVHAFTYSQTQLLPMLQRIWPMPDDLPHAAGAGDFARVKRWFDAAGKPALGHLAHHFPANDAWSRGNLNWGTPNVQHVLDTALAWAVVNSHFEIAGFLLDHGADINTDWSSHEPASILHELVWRKDYAAMQFLIDRGIDMTIEDYRWGGTAEGWAYHAAKDEKLAQWLADAYANR